MRPIHCACLALSLFAASTAWAASSKEANAYYQVRDRAQLAEAWTAEEVQLHPSIFAGKLIEVHGTITAIAGSEDQTTFLLGGNDGKAPLAVTLPAQARLSQWAFLDVGAPVRFLCKVVSLAGSATGSLELVVPVKEYDALQVDQSRAEAIRKAAELRQRTTPRQMASRGVSASTYRRGASRDRLTREEVLAAYTSAVQYFNRRMPTSAARAIAKAILEHSERNGLDARLVMAVIAVESNFNPNAVSPVGAMGLGQLMPGTAGDLGVGNAFDLQENLSGSTRLLSTHIRNMSDNGEVTEEAIKLALACYNAGAGAVRKYKGIPPYRETQNYVKKITRLYKQMCGQKA